MIFIILLFVRNLELIVISLITVNHPIKLLPQFLTTVLQSQFVWNILLIHNYFPKLLLKINCNTFY